MVEILSFGIPRTRAVILVSVHMAFGSETRSWHSVSRLLTKYISVAI